MLFGTSAAASIADRLINPASVYALLLRSFAGGVQSLGSSTPLARNVNRECHRFSLCKGVARSPECEPEAPHRRGSGFSVHNFPIHEPLIKVHLERPQVVSL